MFEAVGQNPEDITATVDAFRDALGPNNGNSPVAGDPFGRRQINWDAAPDSISDPNLFPGDFFNAGVNPRARGIEFVATGSTTGFELSATEASGTPPVFGVPTDFQPFSPERIFRTIDGNTFDVKFFSPVDQTTEANVRGLGVVFGDVETEGAAVMSFFDRQDNLLFTRNVLTGPDIGLSFLGVIFDSFAVSRVGIIAGGSGDNVIMDDFIFGEPVPVGEVPIPAAAALFPLGAALIARRRQKRS